MQDYNADELKQAMNEGLPQLTPFADKAMEIKQAVNSSIPKPPLAMRLDYEPETGTARVEIVFDLAEPNDLKAIGDILRDTMIKVISNKLNDLTHMIPSKKQIVDKQQALLKQRDQFIMEKTPRLHRLLMEAFPHLKDYFKYSISNVEGEPGKFILLREKKGKLKEIAKNF
uniref:Uncharacterized protein n=1 Tax=viral metagenome TaxID=1070528 RepID=A0A6H1ZAY0_9ZZZZ